MVRQLIYLVSVSLLVGAAFLTAQEGNSGGTTSSLLPAAAPLKNDSGIRRPAPAGVDLFKIGKTAQVKDIFNPEAGTVSVWLKFKKNHYRRDHTIFHTDDSRYVLYVDTYYSSGLHREVVRIAARAGGNRRAVDSGYARGNFPETSIIIDNDGTLATYGAHTPWYSPRPYAEGEWHHVTMTWEGYPKGTVKIYLDKSLVGEKPYDKRYDDGRPMPSSIAIGVRPDAWVGEIIERADGSTVEARPRTNMSLESGGMEIKGLRLFNSALTQEEINKLK